jgi:hypothetical protein
VDTAGRAIEHLGNGNGRDLNGMLAHMDEPRLPVDAARGDARHRDVRGEVFAVVPQQRAGLRKRLFWWLVLRIARFPAGLRLLQRARGS